MTENLTPPEALRVIIEDLDRFKSEQQTQQELQAKHQEESGQLFRQAMQLLRTRGMTLGSVIGTGAGRGIVGYRMREISHLVTQPVNVEIGDQKFQLSVTQKKIGGPNIVRDDGFSIEIITGEDKAATHTELFRIRHSNITNWRSQEASDQEMTTAGQILEFLEQNLPERPADVQATSHLRSS